MGVILFIVAIIISSILFPIGILVTFIKNIIEDPLSFKAFKDISYQLGKMASAIDTTGNVVCGDLFNIIFISKNGYLFGNRKETISSALGKNQKLNTLSLVGRCLVKILNIIEKDHCIKAIDNKI